MGRRFKWIIRAYSVTSSERGITPKSVEDARKRPLQPYWVKKYGQNTAYSCHYMQESTCQVQGLWDISDKNPCTLNSYFCPVTVAGQRLWGYGVLLNFNKLQKYLENSGNATVILSFDTLKEILGIEVNYTAALCIKKDFHCSYVVDDVSEKEKWIRFCRTETQNDEDTTITTLASMLWW